MADVRPLSHSVTSEGEHDCTDWLHPTTPGVEINHIVFAGKNVSSNGIFKMLNFPTSPCNFDGQPGHEGGLDDEETSGMVRRVTCSSEIWCSVLWIKILSPQIMLKWRSPPPFLYQNMKNYQLVITQPADCPLGQDCDRYHGIIAPRTYFHH